MKHGFNKENSTLLLLWIYIWVVLCAQSILLDTRAGILLFLFCGILSFAITAVLIYIVGFIEKKSVPGRVWTSKQIWITTAVIFFSTLALYTGTAIILYTGFSKDPSVQLEQAVTGVYNTWHPPLHTVLFFTIPAKLGLGKYGIVFLQLVYFSLAFSYLAYTMLVNRFNKIWLAIWCIFVWTSPYLLINMWKPLKDIAFMIFAMLLWGYFIQIVCTKGQWLHKKRNIALFAIVLICCRTVRHNGILFTLPVLLILLFYIVKKWKIRLSVIIAVAVCFASVKVLYVGLSAEKADMRVLETIGMPLTIWSNVMKNEPEALPEETQKVMYEIGTRELYETQYNLGDFNSIKWAEKQVDFERINALTYPDVLKYTWQCLRYAPKSSAEAVVALTSEVWRILPPNRMTGGSSITDKLTKIEDKIHVSLYIPKMIFVTYGYINLALIAVGVIFVSKKKYSGLYCLPLLCYNFGTMLLLSSCNDFRFFFLNIPIFLPVLFLILKKEEPHPNMEFAGELLNRGDGVQ